MADEKFTYEHLDKKTNELLLKYFTSPTRRTGYIKCKGCLLPEYYTEFGDRIRQMEVRDDDIWVCSSPKAGTTWTQEMVWCIGHDVDLEAAKQLLTERFPFLELSPTFDGRSLMASEPKITFPPLILDSVTYINELPSPRYIKTHLPFNLLPKKLQNNSTRAKIVYVARNPRDTCVSYYHHCKLFLGYKGSLEQFAELFLEGNGTCASYFGNLFNSMEFCCRRGCLITPDLKSVIHKTADFMGKSLDENDVDKLLDHLSFSSMKKNPAVNFEPVIEMRKKYELIDPEGSFIRKGEVGEWKAVMTSEQCERFGKWEKENLREIDFTFSA